nr:hypothetical protein OG999_31345 [Streptomyces sp. NBC_00886]
MLRRSRESADADWAPGEYERDFVEPFRTANKFDGWPVAVQAEADVVGIWYRRADVAAVGHEPRGPGRNRPHSVAHRPSVAPPSR